MDQVPATGRRATTPEETLARRLIHPDSEEPRDVDGMKIPGAPSKDHQSSETVMRDCRPEEFSVSGGVPIQTDTDRDIEWCLKWVGAGHFTSDQLFDVRPLAVCNLEHQLVVNL